MFSCIQTTYTHEEERESEWEKALIHHEKKYHIELLALKEQSQVYKLYGNALKKVNLMWSVGCFWVRTWMVRTIIYGCEIY